MSPDKLSLAHIFPPGEGLTEIVRHVYYIRQSAQSPLLEQQLVPNYELMLAFNFGPAVRAWMGSYAFTIEQTAVIGPLTKLLCYQLPPGAEVLIVVFTLNGFYRLMGKPIPFLRNDAGNCLQQNDTAFEVLWAQLKDMGSVVERIEWVRAYLLEHTAPADEDVYAMLDGVELFNNPIIDPVRALAQTHQLSARSVQLRFQTHLGVSAKELARFLRFKKVVTKVLAQYPAPPDWVELVYVYGYHDQSHLSRDFQQFIGLSPTKFVEQLASQNVCITQPGVHY